MTVCSVSTLVAIEVRFATEDSGVRLCSLGSSDPLHPLQHRFLNLETFILQ